MSIESKLARIKYYYSTHLTLILETISSTIYFWGYKITFLGNGVIKAIKDEARFSLYQNSNRKVYADNKFENIGVQINQKPETIKDRILSMGLVSFFSLFEAFNKDYFQGLYLYKPELMKSKKKNFDLDYILQFKTLEELHKSLSHRQTEKFGYMDIDKFADFLLKKFSIELKKDLDCWSNLRESYYRRNCIVHNDGEISEIYLEKLSLNSEQYRKNLHTDIEYIWKFHQDLHKYLDFIDNSIRRKFKLKSYLSSI